MGLFLALTISALYRETAFSHVKVEAIEYVYIYCSPHVSMGNAKWQIITYVANRGTQSVQLTDLFVNERKADVYGLVYGDSLDNGSLIGSDLPVDGLNLLAGEGFPVVIWIGDELFSSGTTIDINFNTINKVLQKKSIRLK